MLQQLNTSHLCGLRWTLSSGSTSLCYCGAQDWTQNSRCGLTKAEQRGRIPSRWPRSSRCTPGYHCPPGRQGTAGSCSPACLPRPGSAERRQPPLLRRRYGRAGPRHDGDRRPPSAAEGLSRGRGSRAAPGAPRSPAGGGAGAAEGQRAARRDESWDHGC